MSWLEHVWSDIVKDTLYWKPKEKKPIGRPKKKWIDEPSQNFRILGVDNSKELANDREEWRKACRAVMSLNGL